MKKNISKLGLGIGLVVSFLSSCDSPAQKEENAQKDVKEAEANLQQAKNELNPEYAAFKADAELKIAANEKRIIELNEILNKPGKLPLDEHRKKRISELEEKNSRLKSRIFAYEQDRSDWETFKREFNHDMDGLGKAFEDLGKDNKK
jgi:hypothetical protein